MYSEISPRRSALKRPRRRPTNAHAPDDEPVADAEVLADGHSRQLERGRHRQPSSAMTLGANYQPATFRDPMRRDVASRLIAAARCAAAACSPAAASSSSSSTPRSSAAPASTPIAGRDRRRAPSAPQIGFEGIPIESGPELAPASTTGTGTVDGIQCGADRAARLPHPRPPGRCTSTAPARAARRDRDPRLAGRQQTPEGPVAAGGQCIYWLHTHAPDGVIHIESPTQRDLHARQLLRRVAPAAERGRRSATLTGKVTAFVNGKPWNKSVRDIPLDPPRGDPVQRRRRPPFRSRLSNWSKTQL